jgi:3-hydroxy-9,10-secoandrosta-1,3,5(10)-triene-9,17-dione monooxygenase
MAELSATDPAICEILRTYVERIGDGGMPAEPIAMLRVSALRMLQPVRFGGLGTSVEEFVKAVAEFARIDASAGWLTALFNVGTRALATLHGPIAGEVWGDDGSALVAIGHRAQGRCIRDDMVVGRWRSVVGATHADWLLLAIDDGRWALIHRGDTQVDSGTRQQGLDAAGIADVTVSGVDVDSVRIVGPLSDATAGLMGASMAAAVVGSADGFWQGHVDQMRARLATSHGGEGATADSAAQLAWAASDIDAAEIQVAATLSLTDSTDAHREYQQAAFRARNGADRVMANSRHALQASDPVTARWRDVQIGSRLAEDFFVRVHNLRPC